MSQKWTLIPDIEINIAAQNDDEMEVGSGLSEVELGLRLSYVVSRQISPYVGVNWTKKYGATADYAREEEGSSGETVFVLGINAWF